MKTSFNAIEYARTFIAYARSLWLAVLVAAAMPMLVSCSSDDDEEQAIAISPLVGTWESNGARLLFDIKNMCMSIKPEAMPETGRYKYTQHNGLLVLTFNNKDTEYSVEELNQTTLVLKAQDGKPSRYTRISEDISEPTDTIDGHDFVDLGLSVLWATCNIGASKPEEYGSYFAWGETAAKAEYHAANSMTYGLTKDSLRNAGIMSRSGYLTEEHDAAQTAWKGWWRTPANDEMTELEEECIVTWITYHGVNGIKVMGPSGNSIFLPAAGYISGTELCGEGTIGRYWSSMPDETHASAAYCIDFTCNSFGSTAINRFSGRPVRAVTEP